ncbi:MAG: tRNA threonylcarbamoyladenosine dehydratase [Burkholderiaceae bacterium]|jgi:tRNA A37 threonylcarbamoyladenosine dehydratase|nr:tRNA threonylcarbamoyladenosine dehydratase [Burkholderiaceae bacterium]
MSAVSATVPADAGSARRFSGLQRLFGTSGAAAIRAAHAVVVGVGGVGSWAAETLARSGVARLTLIDLDHVAESNINRQVQALESTVGQAKVLAMRERIAQINPECRVLPIDEFVEPGNWLDLLTQARQSLGEVDAVIDCCDQPRAKLIMAAWARTSQALFITAGAAGGKRLAHRVEIDDLAHVTHDPLLAQLRQRLRKEYHAPREGRRIGITCAFSRESVAAPDPSCLLERESQSVSDGTLNCHGYGSMVAVTATFGQCAAGWIIDQLAMRARL